MNLAKDMLKTKHLKGLGVFLISVKIFGLSKTLIFMLGGVAGYMLALHHAKEEE